MTAPLPVARPLQGILWMLASGLCFVAVNGIVRAMGTDLPAVQAAFLRFAFGVVFVAPALWGLLRSGVALPVLRLAALRGVVHIGAVVLWFFAMARLPVAEVVAIGYLNPILVTLGAVLLFGERLGARHLAAAVAAVAGALVVLRPGVQAVEPGHLAQIGAAFCFAASYLAARQLGRMAGPGAVVALMSAAVTLGLAPLAWAVWVPPAAWQVAALALVAGFATAAHYCMMRAFAAAPLSVTQPVVFLQIVWATLLGTLVFGEPVDPWVIAGGGIIVAAVSALAWAENRRPRNLTPAPSGA
jgi:drug/metabolite transporter (DMT)-like permease